MPVIYQISASWCGHCPPAFIRAKQYAAQADVPIELIMTDRDMSDEHTVIWNKLRPYVHAFPSYAITSDHEEFELKAGGFNSMASFIDFLNTQAELEEV